MTNISKCLFAGAALLSLAACAGSERTASGFTCPNGRPHVSIMGGTGPSFGACDPVAQDAVDRKVAAGRTYRYLTGAEYEAAQLNALVVGGPAAGTLPAPGSPGFGVPRQ